MKKVTIYTTQTCAYCHMLKRWLDDKNIDYVEHRVDLNPIAAQNMVMLSGQMGVPFTTVEDSKDSSVTKILGYDVKRLQEVL